MCGFIGNYNTEGNKSNLYRKIEHRGPDNTSKNYNENWNVEFCRLSINDLSSDGNQPFKLGKITAFINGEIYNFRKLKKLFNDVNFVSNSDCEIIPHMYRKFGINFIDQLDGMFSIVLIDDELNKLFLIKDAYGKKPLYYKHSIAVKGIEFSSEQRFSSNQFDINPDNLKTLFFHHFKFFDQTPFKDQYSIPPGCYLEFSENKLKITKWYKLKKQNLNNIGIEKQFIKLFDNSIKKRLMSDVKMGVFLSGGLDSNLIVNSLNKNGVQDIETFSAIIDQKISLERNNTDSVEIIKSMQKNNNYINNFINIDYNYLNKNLVKMISEADHPIIDSSYIIAYACAHEAKKVDRKVIFAGIAADECFGGYHWQERYKKKYEYINFLVSQISRLDSVFINSQNRFVNYLTFPYFQHNSSLGLQFWRDKNLDFTKDVENNTYNSIKKYVDDNNKYFKGDFKNFLDYLNLYGVINHQVTIYDLACMLNSIENRSPFLDKELFEFCFSISSKYKKPNKILLEELSISYFDNKFLNRSKSGPTINYNIFFEKKHFNENMKNFIINNLDTIDNYVSSKLAYKIKNNFNDILKEKYLIIMSIFKFLTWFKYNIEKSISKNASIEEIITI